MNKFNVQSSMFNVEEKKFEPQRRKVRKEEGV